jgi:hypothetical protein
MGYRDPLIEGMSASYLIGLFGECESSWALGLSVHPSVVGIKIPVICEMQSGDVHEILF